MLKSIARQLILAQATGGAKRQRTRSKPAGVALCPPPAVQTNRGDEAMTEVCIRQLLAAGWPNVDVVQSGWQSNEHISSLPGVNNVPEFGPGFYTLEAVREQVGFARYIAGREHFIVLAADIMDGIYSVERAESIANMMHIAAKVGVNVWLLNASVAAPVDPRKLPRVSQLGTIAQVYARGEDSYQRLRQSGMQNLQRSIDLVFLLEPKPFEHVLDGALSRFINQDDRPLVGISASPRMDIDRFVQGCQELRNRYRCRFLIIAHHIYMTAGKMLESSNDRLHRRLADSWPKEDLFYVLPMPSAAQIKALTGRLVHVFSGYLHLTIEALGMGTAVTGFAYNGKFEEQYRAIGAEAGLAYEDQLPADPTRFAEWMCSRYESSPAMSERIRARLPDVQRLAASQLERITPA